MTSKGAGTGAAWLSSARVVRCMVKSYNERNPCPVLLIPPILKLKKQATELQRRHRSTQKQHRKNFCEILCPSVAKNNMKKFLFYFTSVIIIIFFEILFSIPHSGTVFGLFFIIFIGLYRGPYSGCTVGFFIGIIDGVFFAATFGTLSFSYSIIGYLSGRLPKRIDEENPFAQIFIVFLGVAVSNIISLIIEVLFTGIPGIFSIASITWLIIPAIISPAFFLIFKKWWLFWFDRLDVER